MQRKHEIESALRADGLDGWLLYDFRGSNPIAARLAGIPAEMLLSRRWACFIPASGEPRWLVHAIEAGSMRHLAPGASTYVSWQAWREGLRTLLAGASRVAMEVSPGCAIPYVSRVDAGTAELVRSLGVEVLSSADLIQVAEAVWSDKGLASHRYAAQQLMEVKDAAFAFVADHLAAGRLVSEVSVQDYMMSLFRERQLLTDHPPIVAVNAHAADPHFAPDRAADTPIRIGDTLLIDLWCRQPDPGAVFADITWMAYAGAEPPARLQHVFDVVRSARDAAVAFADARLRAGMPVYGYEVDDAARSVITAAGFGDAFIHRTGHSIGTDLHGTGVNIDNLETQDRRRLLPGVGFSIEPGVYLAYEGIGVRLEIDCHVSGSSLQVTTVPLQDRLVLLLPAA